MSFKEMPDQKAKKNVSRPYYETSIDNGTGTASAFENNTMDHLQENPLPVNAPRRFSHVEHRNERDFIVQNSWPELPTREMEDETDSIGNYRRSSHHRRNLSEDLTYSNNLQPLPNTRHQIGRGARDQLLNPNAPMLSCFRRQSDEEIKKEGKELFYNFAAERFLEEELNPYEYDIQSSSFSNPAWQQAGKDLRMLADKFSKSAEREKVRVKACAVDMSSLTCENFFHLCAELFNKGEGGITQERIVVLFTFVIDIAIYQVRKKAEKFISKLMEWSLKFLYEYICAWVEEHGGWSAVLSRGANFVYNVALFSFLSLGIVAFGIFIVKSYKNL